MEVLRLFASLYEAIDAITHIPEHVQGHKAARTRLGRRCATILPHLHQLEARMQEDHDLEERHLELLGQFLQLLQEAIHFVNRFQDQDYFLKAWRRNCDCATFVDLSKRLDRALRDLPLGEQLDTAVHRIEDWDDARVDINDMFESVRRWMRQPIPKAIREDMRVVHRRQLDAVASLMSTDGLLEHNQVVGMESAQGNVLDALHSIRSGTTQLGVPPLDMQLLTYVEDDNSSIELGSFGLFYHGAYSGVDVSVKIIPASNVSCDSSTDLERHLLTHAALDSSHVIHLYGAHISNVRCTMVLDGVISTLHHWLHDNQSPLEMSLCLKMWLLCDVARGMEYLHSCDVIHGDLRPLTCSIGGDLR